MNNTRFATAMHIMTLLAKESQGAWMSSEWIAGSININPVMVRKEIGALGEAGLVESRKGKDGGSRLAKNPKHIPVSAIYQAVKNTDVLGKKNQHPSPKCPVGKHINRSLDKLSKETSQIVLQFLNGQSLADFSAQFK